MPRRRDAEDEALPPETSKPRQARLFSESSGDEAPVARATEADAPEAPEASAPDDRASKARRALAEARAARQRGSVSAAQPPAPDTAAWPGPTCRAAAEAIFSGMAVCSTRLASRHYRVPRGYLTKLGWLGAHLSLKAEAHGLRQLLGWLEEGVARGAFRARRFSWLRMYDETPTKCWTHEVASTGDLIGQATGAKVMAAQLAFSFVFEDLRSQEALDSSGASRQVMVHGKLRTRLRSLASQHAPIVLQSIMEEMSPPPDVRALVERIFPRRAILRQADLHRSNGAAERGATALEKWPSALFRCSMHRTRTAELSSIMLDHVTESFFLNFTLTLRRQPDALRTFRARVQLHARANVRFILGPPPRDVQKWRAQAADVLFRKEPHDLLSVARKFCWDHVLNGDGRVQGCLIHHCPGHACCPRGEIDAIEKICGPHGIQIFLRTPTQFPRKSWTGQWEVAALVTQMELHHGLISHNFAPVAALAKQKAEQTLARAEEMLRTSAAAAAAAATGAEAPPDVAPISDSARWAEENQQRCGDISAFLAASGATLRMCRMLELLIFCRQVKQETLKRHGALWTTQRMHAAMADPSSHPYRDYVVSHAADAPEARQACQDIAHRLTRSTHTLECPDPDDTRGALYWRMLARLGASLHRLVIMEQRRYPWRLFKLLQDPNAADAILEDYQSCPHILDPMSLEHLEAFPRADLLRGHDSLAELASMAELITDSTAAIERGHATTKRNSRGKDPLIYSNT